MAKLVDFASCFLSMFFMLEEISAAEALNAYCEGVHPWVAL